MDTAPAVASPTAAAAERQGRLVDVLSMSVRATNLALLALAIVLTACSSKQATEQTSDAVDLEIYSLILNDPKLRGQNTNGLAVEYLTVLAESTPYFPWYKETHWKWEISGAEDSLRVARRIAQQLPQVRVDCIKDFASRNLQSSSLAQIVANVPIKFITSSFKREYLSPKIEWPQKYWALFPNATGMIELSQIGYSTSRDQALVYCGSTGGFLAGDGYLVFLVHDQTWRIESTLWLWSS